MEEKKKIGHNVSHCDFHLSEYTGNPSPGNTMSRQEDSIPSKQTTLFEAGDSFFMSPLMSQKEETHSCMPHPMILDDARLSDQNQRLVICRERHIKSHEIPNV